MSTPKHTPFALIRDNVTGEPLLYDNGRSFKLIRGSDHAGCIMVYHVNNRGRLYLANRILDCVNACWWMKDPAMEIYKLTHGKSAKITKVTP